MDDDFSTTTDPNAYTSALPAPCRRDAWLARVNRLIDEREALPPAPSPD